MVYPAIGKGCFGMSENPQKVSYLSHNFHGFDIAFSNTLMDCRMFWARIVSSESESLTTKNTKHSFYEIQYALQGSIEMDMGDGNHIEIAESEFVIVPPNTYHQIVNTDDCGARFIMAFSPDFGGKAQQDMDNSLKQLRCYHETGHMRRVLLSILEKEYFDDLLRRESITVLVESFLLEVLEIVCETAPKTRSSRNNTENAQMADAILSYIHETGGIGVSVSDIAQRFGISHRGLHRLFVSVTGHGLSETIALAKLRKIENLIGTTNLSFTEIAAICGFSDGYAMNKFFKRHNRVNLSEFRTLAKKAGKH